MKAIISSTYDNNYIYFLPIVTWCWNKLGIDVICFLPRMETFSDKILLIDEVQTKLGLRQKHYFFKAPEHKEATYAQCARLYGACLDLPEDEVLVTSDIDMAVFRVPPYLHGLTIWGSDLVPQKQFPMCYASGTVKDWRNVTELRYGSYDPETDIGEDKLRTYQEMLDNLLGGIEAQHFRGNYWGKDQETLYNNTWRIATIIPRARPGTQFASNRVDRDDSYWRERLNLDVVDAHLWRPGYTEDAHKNIMELLQFMYPSDNFEWIDEYRNEYLKLL